MSYEVRFDTAAYRDLARLPPSVRPRVTEKVEALAADPRPPSSEALKANLKGLRRLRIQDYRVSYRVDDEARVVTVVEVSHRRGIYKRIARQRRHRHGT